MYDERNPPVSFNNDILVNIEDFAEKKRER